MPPGRWVRDICPADIGVKDFEPSAFSPRTGLFYVSVQNICMDYKGREVSYIAGTPYWGAQMTRHVGPGRQLRRVHRLRRCDGARRSGGFPEPFLTYSGALVDRRRRRVLRHGRRLVPRRRRAHGQGALVAQARLGDHQRADGVPRAGRTRVRRRRGRCRRRRDDDGEPARIPRSRQHLLRLHARQNIPATPPAGAGQRLGQPGGKAGRQAMSGDIRLHRLSRCVMVGIAADRHRAAGATPRTCAARRRATSTLPQQQSTVATATDTTGLPAEGALARVAIGDLAGIGNNTLDADIANPYAQGRGGESRRGTSCSSDELRRVSRLRPQGRHGARTSPTPTGATAARRPTSTSRSSRAGRRECRRGDGR